MMSTSKQDKSLKENQNYQKLKMFIFNGIFTQYTSGIAFSVAQSKEEAIDNILKKVADNVQKRQFNFDYWFCYADTKSYTKRKINDMGYDNKGYYVEWDDTYKDATKEEVIEVLQHFVRVELEKCQDVIIQDLEKSGGFCGGGG